VNGFLEGLKRGKKRGREAPLSVGNYWTLTKMITST